MVSPVNVFRNRTLFIGDNIDPLRLTPTAVADLIYLDPPGNTGRTYSATSRAKARGVSLKDTWALDDVNDEWLFELEVCHPPVYQAIRTANIVHGDSMAAYLTFMAIRLREMKRILKPAGSIYLHTNPGVSAYLKVVMDALFGQQNFRNEIVWRRPSARTGSRRWQPIHDTILFYTGGRDRTRWNQIPQEQFADYWTRHYRLEDEYGRYQAVPLINRGLREGDQGEEWRGIWPAKNGNHWNISLRILRAAYPDIDHAEWLSTREKLELLDRAGLIHWPPRGRVPRQKIYADMSEGTPVQDIIMYVDSLDHSSREGNGWPTQKPEALLDLLIRVSSDPEDVVLDPFCGSGTTCVVAERLQRHWMGMEQASQAGAILSERLQRVSKGVSPHIVKAPPQPSVLQHALAEAGGPMELKHVLYSTQGGRCRVCSNDFPAEALTTTYFVSISEENPTGEPELVMLCHSCADMLGDQSSLAERDPRHLRQPIFRS